MSVMVINHSIFVSLAQIFKQIPLCQNHLSSSLSSFIIHQVNGAYKILCLCLVHYIDDDDSFSSGQEGGPCTEVLEVFRGWSVYCHHHVREAGLGLAMLYMTVLGFDAITWGYCRQ